MKTIVFGSLLLCAVVPALADPSPDPAAAAKPKKICRLDERATGSIMAPKRICRTHEEWAAIDSANSEAHTHATAVAPSQLSMDALTPHQ